MILVARKEPTQGVGSMVPYFTAVLKFVVYSLQKGEKNKLEYLSLQSLK